MMPKRPSAIRLCLLATTSLVPLLFGSSAFGQASGTEELVVTATRQSQALSKVPLSVTAFTQEKMDSQGVRTVEDVMRLTPGIVFTPGRLSSNIAVRGITSAAGSATTGVYIDDTPIQVRKVGTSAGNAYPIVFDLQRVEILRGPQGTLFGAGSEGGTVRFIQPEPSLTTRSVYARSEFSSTAHAESSYEGGVAFGGPLVEDKLGFRVSGYFRHDGGWIDRVAGLFTVLDSTGKAGVESLRFNPSSVYDTNTNWSEAKAFRVALTAKPTESLKITPSIFYQRQYTHDNVLDIVPAASDFSSGKFVIPQNLPRVDAAHIALPGAKLNEPASDEMILPSVAVDWDLGFATLSSNTAGFYRYNQIQPDYTQLYETTYARRQVPVAGDFAISPAENRQQGITQEIRLQGKLLSDKLSYTTGLFYSKQRQGAIQNSQVNFVSLVSSIANATVPGFPAPAPAVNNGAPFGPGYSAYINYYGVGLLNGVTTYFAHLVTHEEQEAVFGEFSYDLTDKLKVTVGARYGENTVELVPHYDGPNSNLNTPRGYACVPGTGSPGAPACIPVAIGQFKPGEGPFAPAFVTGAASGSGHTFNPKVGVAYQADSNNLYYATVAKGFRPGGAQQRQPSTCNDQLSSLGYFGANGRPESPTIYDSDSVWSYEVGAKNKLFDGRLSFDSSVYYIEWKEVQSSVSLSTCAQSFFDNLGDATSKGFDLQASVIPIDGLVLNAAVGYTDATYNEDTILGGRRLFSKGSALSGNQAPWTVTLSGQYDFTLPKTSIEAYVRSDFTYTSEADKTGPTDPLSVSYDPVLPVRTSTKLLNARAGTKFRDADLSVFVNNITNEHPYLGLTHTINQPYWTTTTQRPRTVGVTLSYRY
jgi:outer membrane receptor protein involved in Fe transport